MNDLALIPDKGQLAVMMDYAEQIAACGLFPVKDRAAAFGMIQIALAECIPPVKVFEKYHLIPSRTGGVMPCLKSIWVMSEFCQRGGKLRWLPTTSPHEVHLEATAPNGSVIEVKKSVAQMRAAGKELGPAWKADPEQMLRYRAAISAIKAICPEVLFGAPADVDVEDSLPRRVPVVEQPAAPAMNPALGVALAMAPKVVVGQVEEIVPDADPEPQDGAVEQSPDMPEPPEAAPEPVAEPEPAPWVDATPEGDLAVEGQEQAIPLADEDPAEVAAPVEAPEPPPAPKSTRPLGSVLQELSKRIKEAGLTPAQARAKVSSILGREVKGIGDITTAEAENLLGVKWE